MDYPTIQVVTLYPGASPDVMTSAVTAPARNTQFGRMSGLKNRCRRKVPAVRHYHFAVPANITAGCRRAGSAGRD
ncbi:hypothetical protein ACLB1Q_01030 [Escherichia coli]